MNNLCGPHSSYSIIKQSEAKENYDETDNKNLPTNERTRDSSWFERGALETGRAATPTILMEIRGQKSLAGTPDRQSRKSKTGLDTCGHDTRTLDLRVRAVTLLKTTFMYHSS